MGKPCQSVCRYSFIPSPFESVQFKANAKKSESAKALKSKSVPKPQQNRVNIADSRSWKYHISKAAFGRRDIVRSAIPTKLPIPFPPPSQSVLSDFACGMLGLPKMFTLLYSSAILVSAPTPGVERWWLNCRRSSPLFLTRRTVLPIEFGTTAKRGRKRGRLRPPAIRIEKRKNLWRPILNSMCADGLSWSQ